MKAQVEPASVVARNAAQQAGLKAVCFTYWFRGHNNPSHAALFARLGAVVEFNKVTFSRRRMVRALQYRLWMGLRERVIYPLVLRRLSQRYNTLFTVDPRQVPFWEKNVIVDMNDPNYDPATLRLLSLPQVKAIVVSTKRTKEALHKLGVPTPVYVIPQVVPVQVDPRDRQVIRERFRNEDEVVAGYLAPSLSMKGDGAGRWRQGMDDLDLLFAAVEQARKDAPHIRLWLFGVPSASVRRYAEGKSWITLFGYVPLPQVLSYVANFDIGAYPRTLALPQGAFSMKLIQYMAFGLPVVSTAVEETLMLEEAGCGIVCRSEEDFSAALVDLARSPEKRAELGRPGKEYARTHTHWSHLPNYEGIVRDVLSQTA